MRVFGSYLIAAADKYEWEPPATTLPDGAWAHLENPGPYAVAHPEALAKDPTPAKVDEDEEMEEH